MALEPYIITNTTIYSVPEATVRAELMWDGERYLVRLYNANTGHEYRLFRTKNYEKAKAEFGYLLDMFGAK